MDLVRSNVDLICANHPAYALYSEERERPVIAYGMGTDNRFRMMFDPETGALVGADSSAHDGYACNLSGKAEFAAGEPITDSPPSCRLCAADTTDPTYAAVPECPDGAIP